MEIRPAASPFSNDHGFALMTSHSSDLLWRADRGERGVIICCQSFRFPDLAEKDCRLSCCLNSAVRGIATEYGLLVERVAEMTFVVVGRHLHEEDRDKDGGAGDGFGGEEGRIHEELGQTPAPRSSSSAETCFAALRVVARCDAGRCCFALCEDGFRLRGVGQRACSAHIALGVVHSGSLSSMR